MLSNTEENYLKALYHLSTAEAGKTEVGTNELAGYLAVKPASANDMLKKLKEKKLVQYEKYGKIRLTATGRRWGIDIIRKHRLWETFLYEKLEFTWDEVHEVAEQLEHIQSAKLVEKLDKFLNYPDVDPHGDAIPNAKGEFKAQKRKCLSDMEAGRSCRMVAVKDNSATFLQYVMKVGLGISTRIKIISHHAFDGNMDIEVNGKKSTVSRKFAENIYVV